MATGEPFNAEAFQGPEMDLDAVRLRPSKRLPRHRQGEPFLKGPIPWSWLEQAGRLPGRALHVGLLLWREAGCCRKRTVRFRLTSAVALGMSSDTARRGLRALQAAGLVSIAYPAGRALDVTINDAPATAGEIENDGA